MTISELRRFVWRAAFVLWPPVIVRYLRVWFRRGLVCALVLSLPTSAFAQEKKESDTKFHVAIGTVLVLQGMDLASTTACLQRGACREANPLMRSLADRPFAFGAVKMGLVAAEQIALWQLHRKHPKAAWWTAVALGAISGVVVIQNARAMKTAGLQK